MLVCGLACWSSIVVISRYSNSFKLETPAGIYLILRCIFLHICGSVRPFNIFSDVDFVVVLERWLRWRQYNVGSPWCW